MRLYTVEIGFGDEGAADSAPEYTETVEARSAEHAIEVAKDLHELDPERNCHGIWARVLDVPEDQQMKAAKAPQLPGFGQ